VAKKKQIRDRTERTRDRFNDFIGLEECVMQSIPQLHPWYSRVVKSHEVHGTSFHDYTIKLVNGSEYTVEVQITDFGTERSGYCRYHDIRLDLISSFKPTDDCKKEYHDWGWRWHAIKNVTDLDKFASVCPVTKWGKLKTCDAPIFIFCIAQMIGRGTAKRIQEIDQILVFDNKKLKANCDYFVDTYGVKINNKIGEPWGSAFVPVHESDLILQSCLIRNGEQFLKTCK